MAEISLSNEEKVKVLVKVSKNMGLTADEVLALYLVLGDGVFFLFDLLQKRLVKFPTVRSFKQCVSSSGEYKIQKLKKRHYLVNGAEAYREDIKRGDRVKVGDSYLKSLGSPVEILGETYILCKEQKNGRQHGVGGAGEFGS